MSKNFASLYASDGDSTAIEQRYFVKPEATRGTLVAATGADFLFTLNGGNIEFTQPKETSPHRTGRHNTSFLKRKKETSWSFSTLFNINTSLGSASASEIDPAVRALLKQGFGTETAPGGGVALQYRIGVPDFTFSLFENGDIWARQARGAFVQGMNFQFPGDGDSTVAWTGNAKDCIYLGIGKSLADNSGVNTITLEAGDGDEFLDGVGGMVMIIKANGTTRSTDTPDGSPRKITAVLGDVITVDGAALADADGSSTPVYLCYYEPTTPTAINNPQNGLQGEVMVTGVSGEHCFRSFGINITNNHALKNNCYGHDGLGGSLFVPGARATVEVTMELDLNKQIFRLFKRLGQFTTQDIDLVHGDSTLRYIEALLPKVVFDVPTITLPDEGSVPVTFTGMAEQTAFDAADEISLQIK